MNRSLSPLRWPGRACAAFSPRRFAWAFGALAVLALGFQSALGFSMDGTKEAFEADDLGYERLIDIEYPGYVWETLRTDFTFSPHNIGEGYRLSIPIVYYAYDPAFVSYFGSNGIAAVDSAVGILNNFFSTKMSAYSADLTEIPESEMRVNYTANGLSLFDLKSAALETLMPRLGLADPERFMFCIQDRTLEAGAQCPFYTFTVLQRNFDPVTLEPSKYVNGNLFTYNWIQYCPPSIFGEWSSTSPVLIDPLDTYESAVASPKLTFPHVAYYGWFHTGLTRDDVGALRYLYSTNNIQVEAAPPDATLYSTNFTTQLLFTSNLTFLAEQALTNPPAVLQALFPGLIVASSTNTWKNVFTTNLTAYFTNSPYDPAGFPPTIIHYLTNITEAVVPQYHDTFANLFTVVFRNGAWRAEPIYDLDNFKRTVDITLQTVTVELVSSPYTPSDVLTLETNTTSTIEAVREVVGDYFILPTNQCGVDVLQRQAIFRTPFTNIIFSVTNTTTLTNGVATTVPLQVTVQKVSDLVTRAFVVYPINCETSSVALRQGFDQITFVRRDFDSLLNRFFAPVTNYYTRVAITNNLPYTEFYQRVVTRPDITFAAEPIDDPVLVEPIDHNLDGVNFNATTAFPNAAGPGTIEGPMTIFFNDEGPVRLNAIAPSGFFVTEEDAIFYFQWGSFDGSTNAPIVYPSNTQPSLNQLLTMNVSPSFIPAGAVGSPYSVNLSVTGGTPPYSWSIGAGSSPLPPGLSLVAAGSSGSAAVIGGAPTQAGSYSFWITVTDAGGRTVNMAYTMLIQP
jgi:hypothetical protein